MKKWYDKGFLVAFICFIFPPLGIYALWKSMTIEKNGKIIFGLITLGWMSLPFLATNEVKKNENNMSVSDTSQVVVQQGGSLYASKEDSIKAYNEALKAVQSSELQKKGEEVVVEESEEISNSSKNIGDIVSISNVGQVPSAVSEDVYDEVMKLMQAKDELGLENLVSQRFVLPLGAGTELKIIDAGLFMMRVRVMSGKWKGASVYVSRDWLK